MKRRWIPFLPLLLIAAGAAVFFGLRGGETRMVIRADRQHQTLESFGASGCWWSQYMGLWDRPAEGADLPAREELVRLLYSREEGIGLTGYRFNLGAGSADSGAGSYSDPHRRAQSFETAPGVYDWTKDEGARWFLRAAAAAGAEEVTLFCNSPLERLTINGTAQMIRGQGKSNIDPAQYAAWAAYCCDAAEHFLAEGVPVRFLSPINEPQWDWYAGNQEGCHYEPAQTAEVYRAFLAEMEKRPGLAGVTLSGPESGEWGGKTRDYVGVLLDDPALSAHFDAVDCHSYWSDRASKTAFARWLAGRDPGRKIRMSEWCEMVGGSDEGMDSALVLAATLAEDLTVLDAVSWSCWVAVAPGGYHDGLIYAGEDDGGRITVTPLKRLWAFGNYARFIRPGYTRVDIDGGEDLAAVAFRGEEDGKQRLVAVLINQENRPRTVRVGESGGAFRKTAVYETSDAHSLERIREGAAGDAFTLAPRSVTTFVLETGG